MVLSGLDRLLQDRLADFYGLKLGCLMHSASVTQNLTFGIDALLASNINISRIFTPEHGFWGTAQYMDPVHDSKYGAQEIPMRSLYGTDFRSLRPEQADFSDLDVLLIDFQDVGSRYYTYGATMALALQAAAHHHLPVVVCDRPNPIGLTQVEGGGIRQGYENFCGLYSVPQRHGLTLGELARLYNEAFALQADLQIIACSQLKRSMLFPATQRHWVNPSPQMPSWEAALVYPGMCLLEGTNISEGRGTTKPFEFFGAPFIDTNAFHHQVLSCDLPGVCFRPIQFVPTFNKFTNQLCYGLQLHVTNPHLFLPLRTGLAICFAAQRLYPQTFVFRNDVYEFRNDVPALDLLLGGPSCREAMLANADFETIYALALTEDLSLFYQYQKKSMLY